VVLYWDALEYFVPLPFYSPHPQLGDPRIQKLIFTISCHIKLVKEQFVERILTEAQHPMCEGVRWVFHKESRV
jgi:hypothetical protein